MGGVVGQIGNEIAGNGTQGILIQSSGSNAFLGGNIIGLNGGGLAPLPNGDSGVVVQSATNVTIGGTTAASRNVISSNAKDGIQFTGAGIANSLVQNNFIGTDLAGTSPRGNKVWGISIEGQSGVTIGGSATAPNRIAFNGNTLGAVTGGVGILAGTGNAVQFNSIYSSVGLGIDLKEDGVTLNDHLDPDTGPNNLQNYPVLKTAVAGPASTTIAGTLDSTPNSTFTIQFFASNVVNPSGFGEGQFYLGQSQTITTDANGSATFVSTVPVHANAGQIISAVVTDSAGNSSEFASDITVGNAATNLTITITASPQPVQVGQDLIYTITAINNGPNPATGVTVVDGLPSTVTYVSSSTPAPGTTSYSGGVVTGNLGTIASGGTTTVTIDVKPNAATPPGVFLVNTASISSNEGSTNGLTSATASTTVIASADLALAITTSPPTPPGTDLLGEVLTYTITVSNKGPSAASNVVVTDNLPAGLTFDSATTSRGIVTQNGQLVTATINSLPANTTATITIMVTPTVLGMVTNTVSLTSDTPDPVPANNAPVSVTTLVLPSADLGVSIAGSPTPGLESQPYTYVVTVTNHGLSNATNVTVVDTLPSSVIFQSSSSNPAATLSRNGQSVQAIFAALASGQSAQLTIIVTPTVSGMITDAASVVGDQGDPVLSNNSATLNSTIAPTADLMVGVTGSPNPVAVGGLLQYVVTVSDLGPDPASNVVATDTLPANVTVVSVAPSQGTFTVNGSLVGLNFGSLVANGVPVTATITVKPQRRRRRDDHEQRLGLRQRGRPDRRQQHS